MPYKFTNRCWLAKHVIEKAQELYKQSEIEVLNYLAELFPNNEDLQRQVAEFDYSNGTKMNIFWEVIDDFRLREHLI